MTEGAADALSKVLVTVGLEPPEPVPEVPEPTELPELDPPPDVPPDTFVLVPLLELPPEPVEPPSAGGAGEVEFPPVSPVEGLPGKTAAEKVSGSFWVWPSGLLSALFLFASSLPEGSLPLRLACSGVPQFSPCASVSQ